ncbi:hypothetical protein CFIMG_005149RA [Ceratocystis fimbriata CBS 114723]|uniref:Uncharacterized protein n=1 Tax=Ceratocystis fimbriata CBS 114723 TaxID=1035309 RepID=A0A2C5X3K2_9PEZI|nr:hypothetical protein CFIMG_005149RA [Ceratocystis fimbriata CBS 114723]
MDFEKSPRQQAMDESNAMGVVRTGLNEEDKELSKIAETPKACTTKATLIFADLDKDMGKQ